MHCACDSDSHYNFFASLERIACLAPDSNRMRDQAEKENRLFALHGMNFPPLSVLCARDVDVVSIPLLSVCI